MTTQQSIDGATIMIIGSSRFTDAKMLESSLDHLTSLIEVGRIVTGKCSGTDAIVRDYASSRGIDVREINLEDPDNQLNLSFFENIENPQFRKLPLRVLQNDPCIKDNVARIRGFAVDAVYVVPGPDGTLGATGAIVKTIAEVAGIEVLELKSCALHARRVFDGEELGSAEPVQQQRRAASM